MTIEKFLGMSGIFGTITLAIVVVFWFSATVFILCIMEVRVTNVPIRRGSDILMLPIPRDIFIRNRVSRHFCTRFVCTGSKRTVNIIKERDMYVALSHHFYFDVRVVRVLMYFSESQLFTPLSFAKLDEKE